MPTGHLGGDASQAVGSVGLELEESSGPGRTHVRITRAVDNLPQGVGTAVPVPPPESCQTLSPPILPRWKEGMWRGLGGWEPIMCSSEGRMGACLC